MANVFIYNAPPLVGKDFMADRMIEMIPNSEKLQFKDKLFELTKAIYCIDDCTWERLYHRNSKEVPTPLLHDLSPRQALIHVSEDVIKPIFGKDYFGNVLRTQIARDYSKNYFISDGGFLEETQPLIDDPNINLFIVQMQDGVNTFEMYGDSRRYISVPDTDTCQTHTFFNDKTVDSVFDMKQFVESVINE